MRVLSLSTLVFLAFFSRPDRAFSADCSKAIAAPSNVGQLTNYAPLRGGINGNCRNRSASGLPACSLFLEDHINGQAAATMGAVPQKGGTSGMFGGLYSAESIAQKIGAKCVIVAAGDRYSTTSNHKSKMDIATRNASSALTGKINQIRNAKFVLIGKISSLGIPQRHVQRSKKPKYTRTKASTRGRGKRR